MHRARRAEERKAKAAWTAGGALFDIAASLIPGADTIKTVLEAGHKFQVLAVEARRDQEQIDLGALGEKERKSLNERILGDFQMLLGGGGERDRIPAVVLFDDAQFSTHDAGAADLLGGLIDRAWARRWPVMIVLTHWLSDWRAHWDAREASAAQVVAARAATLGDSLRKVTLAPVDDLAPALAPDQVRVILTRAGGNPRYLEQMARLARSRPRLPDWRRHGGGQLGPWTRPHRSDLAAGHAGSLPNRRRLAGAAGRGAVQEIQQAERFATFRPAPGSRRGDA
jgi:hypothetical protein